MPAFLSGRGFRAFQHVFAGVLFFSHILGARAASPEVADLADLSVEELARIEITSVSKRAQKLSEAAAAIYVIDSDLIRRSGATTIPEILRLAPNLQVARVDAAQYAISARGFNSTIANKLLVLIDGRTIYTPLFSGVFWDAQDVMIEDIERVEVISGPGATLWGANAVNGIINIITKQASGTQGTLLAGSVGSEERGVALRQGLPLGEHASFRLYGKFQDWDPTERADSTDVADEWHRGQVGFRGDWAGITDRVTFQGDAYDGTRETLLADTELSGANLVAKWSRALAGGDEVFAQAYFDYTRRETATFEESLHTFDVEFQHFLQPHPRHGVTWGGGYRHSDDEVTNSPGLAFLPAEKNLDWGNAFIQDQIALTAETLTLTLGAKVEHNPYTGFEFLPSLRLGWTPSPAHLLWGSLSRALRSPARLDRELFIPGQPPFLLLGGPGFRSEVSNVFELGYRAQPGQASSVSVTFFHAQHDRLRGVEVVPAGFIIGNIVEGESTGVEAWGSYSPATWWVLRAGLLWLDQDLGIEEGAATAPGTAPEGNDPEYQWMLHAALTLPYDVLLDAYLRGTDSLPNPRVSGYTELNLRLAWQPLAGLELALVGSDLLHEDHAEFGAAPARSEFERRVLLQLSVSR